MENLPNYQQLSPRDGADLFARVNNERVNERDCIIIVIGENLLFYLTRLHCPPRSPLPPLPLSLSPPCCLSLFSPALPFLLALPRLWLLCNCNYHFHINSVRDCCRLPCRAVRRIQCITNTLHNWRQPNADTFIAFIRLFRLRFFVLFCVVHLGARVLCAHWCAIARIGPGRVIILSVCLCCFDFGARCQSFLRWVYFIGKPHFLHIKLSHNLYAIHSY